MPDSFVDCENKDLKLTSEPELIVPFHTAMLDAFTTWLALDRVLKLRFTKGVDHYSSSQKSLPDIVLDVVDNFESDGLLCQLLLAFYNAKPGNHALVMAIVAIFKFYDINTEGLFHGTGAEADLMTKELDFQDRRQELLDELSSILVDLDLGDEDFRRCLNASLPHHLHRLSQISDKTKRDALEILFERAHRKPFDKYGYPAILFAHIVDERFSGDTGLREWANVAAKEVLNLESLGDDFVNDLLNPALGDLESGPVEILYLQVEVIQDGANDIKVQMYWDDLNGKKTGAISCKTNELASIIAHQVDTADYNDVPEDREVELIIEVFLPFELMGVDLEFVVEDDETLILQHTVVRRILERNKQFSKQTKVTAKQRKSLLAWKKRWQTFNRKQQKIETHHHWINQEDLDKPLRLVSRLVAREDICCTTVEIDPGDRLETLIGYHMKVGIPVIVWSKNKRSKIREILNDQLDNETTELLSRIWALQKSSLYEPEHSISDLHIIYDDPERLLPSSKAISR